MTHTLLHTSRRHARVALLAVLLLPALGCARAPAREGPAQTAEWQGTVAVVVTNRYSLDMTVYGVVSGQRRRLGLVTASTRESFQFPLPLLTGGRTLRLRAEPVGRGRSEGITTEALVVQPGQRVEWNIESGLARSTVGVY